MNLSLLLVMDQTGLLFKESYMTYKPSIAGDSAFVTTALLAGTTLNGAIGAGDTTITVVSTASFASSGEILIGSELISYSGTTATTFTGCVRGLHGSTAASHLDAANVGELYVSPVVDLQSSINLSTQILSDKDGTIVIRFVTDSGGTDIVRSLNIPFVAANGFQLFSAPCFTPYAQYWFAPMEGTDQTDMFYETKLLESSLSPQLLGLNAFISPTMASQLTRSIIVGQDKAGAFRNQPIDTEGHLKINIQDPLTAFGDMRVAELTPQVQLTFPYNINADLVNTTLVSGGTVTQADSMAVLQTSTNTAGAATLASRRVNKYRAGLGSLARFTGLFTTGVASSQQRVGVGDNNDGFYFGYDGADFGILVIKDGTETWTPQTSWNVDVMDGQNGANNPSNMLLDPTKINVFQIQYQWLGAGQITFYIEDPADGTYDPVHRIAYANGFTTPSLYNPNLPLSAKVINSGNATNLTLKSASMSGFCEGKVKQLGVVNSLVETSTHSTETAFFHLRNKGTYVTLPNRIIALLKALSVGNDANTLSTFKIYSNATLAGVASWTDVNGDDSIMEYDTVQTYTSGGKLLFSGVVGKDSGSFFPLEDLNIIVQPNDIITVTSASVGSGAQAADLVWFEDF